MRHHESVSVLCSLVLLAACASDGTSPANNGGGTTGGGTTGGGTTTAQCFDIAGPSVAQPASLWTQLQPSAAAPPARAFHSTVYDATNDRLIVFAGNSAAGLLNDVWVLSSASSASGSPSWTQLTPSGTPPAVRRSQVSAYDAASNRLVVYGGINSSNQILSDYWVLTNANGVGGPPAWLQLGAIGAPVRVYSSAAFDPDNDRLLVFGGLGCNSVNCTLYSDVYSVTNANGVAGTPSFVRVNASGTTIPARYNATMAFDRATNRLYVYGGNVSTSLSPGSDTRVTDAWVLTGANGTTGSASWSALSPVGELAPGRELGSAILDAPRDRLMVFGGAGTDNLTRNDTWVLSPLTGTQPQAWVRYAAASTPAPGARFAQAIVAASVRNRLILFGGSPSTGQFLNDVWTLRLDNPAAASIEIVAQATTICATKTLQLAAVVKDSAGTVIDQKVTWSIDNAAVATIDPSGVVNGLAAGNVTARACVGAVCAVRALVINAAPPPPPPPPAGSVGSLAIPRGQIVLGQIDLNGGTESKIYPATVVATGGKVLSGYTWTVTSLQPLPHQALLINPVQGYVSGRSTTFPRGTFTMFVTVRDNVGTSVDGAVTIDLTTTCSSNPAQLSPCASAGISTVHRDYFPLGKVGVEYTASIIAGGGTPPYKWTRFSGTIPPGLTLDAATGVLRGIPTTAGVYDFFVRLEDSVGGSNISELNAGVLDARFRLTVEK